MVILRPGSKYSNFTHLHIDTNHKFDQFHEIQVENSKKKIIFANFTKIKKKKFKEKQKKYTKRADHPHTSH